MCFVLSMVGSMKSLQPVETNTACKYYLRMTVNMAYIIPNWSKCGIPLTITWDGNLTACPAWQWPFAPRQPAAERRRHHGSLGSSRAAGYVSGRPEWCLSVAPGAQPSLTAAYLGKSQGSAHAASLNGVPSGESRGFSLTQTAAGYEHLHFIFW